MLGGTRLISKGVRALTRGEAGDEARNPKGLGAEAVGIEPKFGGAVRRPAAATRDPELGSRPHVLTPMLCGAEGSGRTQGGSCLMDPRFDNDAQTGTLPGLGGEPGGSLRREPP